MFLLTKAFKLRDKANQGGHEKPFLEHLEDLRSTVTRIVVTLLLATLACYAFKDTLMDVLRKPIEVVWEQSQQELLPDEISPERWELAKRTSVHASGLSPDAKKVYFQQFADPELPLLAECAGYYRAALTIEPAELREQFIDELPNISPEANELTKTLLTKKPNAQVDAKNNVVYMRSLKPTETFMLSLKLAFFAGIIVSFPFILAFTLQFILPGLKDEEKKALWPALAIGFGLFLSGVFFCYYLVLPKALEFFYAYSMSMGVENEWRIGDYITFATQFTLIFGLAFELPVVVMTLVKIGLLDYDIMSRTRSYAIVSIVVIAAIITPTGDALTLSMLAAPMCLLYEMCIWFAFFTRKKELEEEQREMANYQLASAAMTHEGYDPDTEFDHEEDEGEELDDGEHLEENEELGTWTQANASLDALRAPYDPDADDEDLDETPEDDQNEEDQEKPQP